MTALGSWSLRCDLGSLARASTRATSTRLDRFGSSFLAPSAVQTWHRPPSRRLPATRFRVAAAGGGDRPSWTEAAAGMGRGRTKGEARVPKPPKRGKNPPSSDPDAAGRASRRAAASGARASSERNADADDFARRRGRGRGRGRGASRGAPYSGRVVAETGGAAARAAAADAPRSSAAVTSRNVDALAAFFARRKKNADASSDAAKTDTSVTYSGSGFRLVRCMPHLRRREADDAVSSGRVKVNGQFVRPSRRVVSGDVVTLDGKTMDWEPFAAAVEADIASLSPRDEPSSSGSNSTNSTRSSSRFVYLKYNKPRGVTCTMEPSQRSSMLYALKDELKVLAEAKARLLNDDASKRHRKIGGPARVFPVGRLDRDSSGLVLLTDDGRVPEALLDPRNKASKTYDVDVDRFVSDASIEKLRSGVVITTTQQRDGIETTAATSPCDVFRIPVTKGSHGADALRFVLTEGRNRQIRKMCEAIGVEVTSLHRRSIGDVSLFSATEDGDERKEKTSAGSVLECGGVRAVEGEELMYLARAVAESAARRQAARTGGAKTRAAAPEGWGKRIRDGR